MSHSQHPILFLAKVIQAFRSTLWKEHFIEIPTPIIREHDCCAVVPRLRVADGRYLRESAALALRRNLAYAPRVFEVAQCVREDVVDA